MSLDMSPRLRWAAARLQQRKQKRLAMNGGKALILLVGRVRFERTTNRLKVCCSTD